MKWKNKQREYHRSKQAGLGLIELMISITIGLIVIAGVIQIFVSTLVGSREILDQARLESELNGIMHWMSNDIRRAGYWGADGQDADWASGARNPFTEGVNRINTPTNSCILFSYNLDNDEGNASIGFCEDCLSLPASFAAPVYEIDNMEMFGYRLVSGAVEAREGPENGDNAFSCTVGDWGPLSDSDVVNITGLTFDLSFPDVATVTDADGTSLTIETVQVVIQLDGELANDSSVSKSLSTTVRLGNNLVRE